jgi:hypothetical protein
MIKKFMCAFCATELETFSPICPECGEHSVGWLDSVNGWHEGGCGSMPDGTPCGECYMEDCSDCEVWKNRQIQRQKYCTWHCEECGHELEIWLDQIEETRPAEGDGYPYERRHLMWHCTECGCDYENYWETQWGDTGESQIKRKMWG